MTTRPSRQDAVTMPCPVGGRPLLPVSRPRVCSAVGRPRVCSAACRQAALPTRLRTRKLPAIAEPFAAVALPAAKAGRTHAALLDELVRAAGARREERRVARLLHPASGGPAESASGGSDAPARPLPAGHPAADRAAADGELRRRGRHWRGRRHARGGQAPPASGRLVALGHELVLASSRAKEATEQHRRVPPGELRLTDDWATG